MELGERRGAGISGEADPRMEIDPREPAAREGPDRIVLVGVDAEPARPRQGGR